MNPPSESGPDASPPIPLVVLTGFLGSGKTTLLSRLLSHAELHDTAVLVNELGEAAIDHHLVTDVRGDMVVLASGCVCCTVRDDLAVAIASLLEQRESRQIPSFSRIVLETTGAADPEPIVHTISQAAVLGGRVMVDAVLTVLDVPHAELTLDHPEARSQVTLADRIVLTKSDVASDEQLAHAHRLVELLAPTASRLVASHGEVEPSWALAPGMATIARRSERASAWLEAPHGVHCDHDHVDHDHHHHGDHDPHHHSDDDHGHGTHRAHGGLAPIRSLSVTLDRPVRWGSFALWASMLTQLDARRVLRVKALLAIEGEPLPVAFHAVQGTVYAPAQLASWPNGPRASRVVVLTRGIDDRGLADLERTLRETALPAT